MLDSATVAGGVDFDRVQQIQNVAAPGLHVAPPSIKAELGLGDVAFKFLTSCWHDWAQQGRNWLDAAWRLKVTYPVITPNNLVAVIKDPRAHQSDLSSLELIISIGAPLSAATQQRAMENLKGEEQATRPGPIGWLLPGMEALLLDPTTSKPLPNKDGPTGPGELVVCRPSVFTAGYNQRPAGTDTAFVTIAGKS
ncbi:hypothetical protein GGF31_007823 [Allomyces arbusculus]|nr:hypothetical protein GGF31_007823 [Allomyces arbusculus]